METQSWGLISGAADADRAKRLIEARAIRIERETKEKAEAAARRKAERDAAKKKAAAEQSQEESV